MKLSLLLVLSLIVSTHCQQDSTEGQYISYMYICIYTYLRWLWGWWRPQTSTHNNGDNYGALQVCDTEFGWRHIILSGWTRAAARLACRQLSLGYLSKRVLVYSIIKLFNQNTDASSSTLELIDDVYIRKVTDCSCIENADRLNDCIEDIHWKRRTVITVNCSKKLMISYICTKAKFYRQWWQSYWGLPTEYWTKWLW